MKTVLDNENRVEVFKKIVKNLSEKKFRGFKSYNIGKMMADNLALYDQFGIGNHAFLKMFSTFIFNMDKLFLPEDDAKRIIAYLSDTYVERKDFIFVYDRLEKILDDVFIMKECKSKSLNIFFIFDIINILPWYIKLKSAGLNSKCCFFLIKRLEVCYKLQRLLNKEKIESKCYCFISQYDAHDTDNLISQYLKHKNIPTISLQHGHFHASQYLSKNVYRIGTPFEGFVSDYFLVWGEYTKKEAISNGLNPKQIRCVGSLKTLPDIPKDNFKRTNKFAVILNGRYGYEDNTLLLTWAEELAKTYNFYYTIRPHPAMIDVYKNHTDNTRCLRISNQSESICELAKECDFVICGNSTVVSEMLKLRKCVLCMKPTNSIDYYGRFEKLRFSTYEELIYWINILYNAENEIFKIVDEYKNVLISNLNVEQAYRDTIIDIVNCRSKQ